jgi:bifunctional UDP-N-acetylglucosamine pyrophosphorylase/glucosamine-1-phosphate N-acetyltransferase
MNNNLRILILAAGKSTRMKSKYAKVLHRAGGHSLVEHVLGVARKLAPDISVVVGHSADQVKSLISEVMFIDQKEQLGTGHAVLAAREHFSNYSGNILVMPGDVPLITAETLESLVQFHRDGGFRATVLTADVADPRGYGRIVRRNDNEIESIIEHRDATPQVLKIREINSGIYIFDAPALFESLAKIRNDNDQREYYLTDVVGILVGQKQKVGAFKVTSTEEVLGINTRQELAVVDRLLRRRKCESLMTDGVTILDPDSVFIDTTVQIGADSVIYPSVQIYGTTSIGEDATIHSFSRISNSKIGSRCMVLEGTLVSDCTIGDDVFLGPYANLHTGTNLADGAHVGNFVEVKKSVFGAGSKSKHLAYLGDATLGKKVNIGAGVITCNYDGVNKHPTVIEDGVFVGTDSQLIAPVRIGKDSYVAAGSSITEDVPPESLAIARGRQVVKEGWAKGRKKK